MIRLRKEKYLQEKRGEQHRRVEERKEENLDNSLPYKENKQSQGQSNLLISKDVNNF